MGTETDHFILDAMARAEETLLIAEAEIRRLNESRQRLAASLLAIDTHWNHSLYAKPKQMAKMARDALNREGELEAAALARHDAQADTAGAS